MTQQICYLKQPTAYVQPIRLLAVCCTACTAEKTHTEIFHCVIKSAVGFVQLRRIISCLSCSRYVASRKELCYSRLSLSLYYLAHPRVIGTSDLDPPNLCSHNSLAAYKNGIKIKIPSRTELTSWLAQSPPRGF